MATIDEASILVINPAPVRGIGNASGFRMMLQDRNGRGLDTLAVTAADMVAAANQTAGLAQVFTLFETSTPQLYLDVDRSRRATRCRWKTPSRRSKSILPRPSSTISTFSAAPSRSRHRPMRNFVAPHRPAEPSHPQSLGRGRAAGRGCQRGLPHRTYRVERHNLLPGHFPSSAARPAVRVPGRRWRRWRRWPPSGFPGRASGDRPRLFSKKPPAMSAWRCLRSRYCSYSWCSPLSTKLDAAAGHRAHRSHVHPVGDVRVWVTGWDNNVLQVGLIVLVGLAAKNAILIVEFARQDEAASSSRFQAAVNAARLRLRPIVMTSLAFILGVVPLVFAIGPGAENAPCLGVAVFSGCCGLTIFDCCLPWCFMLCRGLALRWSGNTSGGARAETGARSPAGNNKHQFCAIARQETPGRRRWHR